MGKLLRRLRNERNSKNYEDNEAELDWLDFDNEEEYEDEEYEDEEYEDEEYEDEEYEDEEYEEEEYEDEEYEDEEYEDEEYEDEEYEDEEYEEEEYEDEEYEDEEYEDEEPARGIKRLFYKFTHMSTVDHVVMFTGLVVLILAGFTGTLYLNAKNTQKQVEAFAEVGVGLEEISMIGESGLVAIADAQAAKLMVADMEDEEEQESAYENAEVDGKTAIALNLTSIQKDLKIKFVNKKTGKLISSIEFEVEIEKPSGDTYQMKDDDKDGIIYQKDIAPGRYQIKIISPTTHDAYSISTEKQAITVRDTIEYKKVDVSDEVKTEAQVNVAVEDTKVNEVVVESTNKDTVEWVESTKTLISGTEKTEDNYVKVDKSKITDPSTKSSLGFRLLAEVEPTEEPTEEPKATEEPTAEPEPTEEPTQEPTAEPTEAPVKTAEPTEVPVKTAEPTQAPTPTPITPTAKPTVAPTATPTAKATATPTAKATATPTAKATATPKATPTPKATATPNKAKTDTSSNLKDNDGNQLYVKDTDGSFRKAKFADYYTNGIEFYKKESKTTGEYKYTGWQVIDGVTYFFDKEGKKVTGEQVIQGAKYNFNSDGSLNSGSGHMGIDVSKWNGSIDWEAVRNSGVSYVIIRCGYRGSTTGALIEDPTFKTNIKGATKAGLKVGVYFFTQAVNEVEAVEEASMVLGLIKGYNISFPVFLDVEASKGRGDAINAATRTGVCRAFCQTIQNSGYKSGIYANKTWFESYMDTSSLTNYKIWLAQYAATPSYSKTRYDMWQYSSKGTVSGIKGNVDMNISYMGY